jgi:hypothetical protein
VADGFAAVRGNREAVIEMFLSEPSLGTYEVFGTRASGERALAATIRNGTLEIKDTDLFAEAIAKPGNAGKLLAGRRISEHSIQAVIDGLDGDRGIMVGSLLRKYLGWTWKAALDAHSKEKALLRSKEESP